MKNFHGWTQKHTQSLFTLLLARRCRAVGGRETRKGWGRCLLMWPCDSCSVRWLIGKKLLFWSSHSVSAASGFQPLFEVFYRLTSAKAPSIFIVMTIIKRFDLKTKARDGVRRRNNSVSVEHNWPVVCLNGILAAGNVKKVYLNHFVCVVERKTHTHIPAEQVSNSVAAAGTGTLLSIGGRNSTETHWNATTPHNEQRLFRLIRTKRSGAFSQACWWAEPRQ